MQVFAKLLSATQINLLQLLLQQPDIVLFLAILAAGNHPKALDTEDQMWLSCCFQL